MDTFQCLRLFVRVVEIGSFTVAAKEASLGQPAVSKAVAGFERELGVRLLDRATTGVALTDEGRRFYTRAKHILEDYDGAVAQVRGLSEQVAGLLRINAPVGLGELRLNKLLQGFVQEHPMVSVDLVLNDRMIDLVEEGIDVAIRLGGPMPPTVVARQVGLSPRRLVAAPAYLRGRAKIVSPVDLIAHDWVWYAGPGDALEFTKGDECHSVRARGRYSVNNSLVLRECLLDGVGLGSAPAWLVQDLIDDGSLAQLLVDWELPAQSVHILYPHRRQAPQRTRALLRFLADGLVALPGILSPNQRPVGAPSKAPAQTVPESTPVQKPGA